MPKTSVGAPMKAHLAQGVTTLAMCWHIVRMDNQTFGFTTFDRDLTIEGVLYLSTSGFSATAIQSGSTGAIDNLQVMGFFSEDPGGVREQDVKNRLFDYARVYLFFINWANLAMTPIRMRTGWLGETVVAPNGAFAAELRGLTQALVHELGNFYSPLCRNDLGDAHCKVPIRPPVWVPSATVSVGDYTRAVNPGTDEALMQAIFKCTVGGASAPTEPVWNVTVGEGTADYQVIWQCVPAYSQIGIVITPMDRHNFVSAPLSYPASAGTGSEGSIMVLNSVSARSTVEVSDGTTTVSIPFPDDTRKEAALGHIANYLVYFSGLNMTYAFFAGDPPLGITLTNHTGLRGSITKSGDILGAIKIENFADQYLDAGSISWITGGNAGVSMELKHYEPGSNVVTMYLGMLMPIQAGDKFWYHPGCDKRRDTCVKKYNNILNNRSEPDIPGIDRMLTYPDS